MNGKNYTENNIFTLPVEFLSFSCAEIKSLAELLRKGVEKCDPDYTEYVISFLCAKVRMFEFYAGRGDNEELRKNGAPQRLSIRVDNIERLIKMLREGCDPLDVADCLEIMIDPELRAEDYRTKRKLWEAVQNATNDTERRNAYIEYCTYRNRSLL